MDYSRLARLYEELESTAKKLKKAEILGEFYGSVEKKDLYGIVLLSMGQVFPSEQENLGIASEMMRKILQKVTGAGEKDVTSVFNATGDLGIVAEALLKKRKQHTLISRRLSHAKVMENLQSLPYVEGKGSQEKKMGIIAELLSSASPVEARYIVRTVLGEMRIGVAAGTVRDALARAFSLDKSIVERLFDVTGDYGRVATLLAQGKTEASVELFTPLRVMLADRAKDLKSALEKFGNAAIETKYDGFRVQIHKDGPRVKIFSRRMEDVTRQFPDIEKSSRESLRAQRCIVEGEVIAVGKNGSPLPFQLLSRRIQRKHEIEKMLREIPVVVRLFDALYVNGETLMSTPLRERWAKLKPCVKTSSHMSLAEHVETRDFDEANAFYKSALRAGQEGVMVKNMEAPYQPGKRVGYWLKVKEIMETLDCVLTGATHGEGKRGKWFSSFLLSVRGKDGLVEIGRMASGTSEQELEELTRRIEIVEDMGREVTVKPKIIVEVAYEEIQRSPTYSSGMALRFPRLVRIRDDKEEADDVKKVSRLFRMQK
ncbi:MAG: ATP-dependent DNA ligase [Candidatus Aenigmarchaeota archaeon]|nr:ATP-dependent DNA ligase [Candidatus Aenigmarchaeota archaeon]